jgi:hypothetical protein
MDDWYSLARRYPQYMKVTSSTLKDYGHMACMDFIDETFAHRGKDVRILEFGHGFNPEILERFQLNHEVWGADRDQGLNYFADVNWEDTFHAEVASRCGDVKFVRELLTSATPAEIIPDGYFDCIMSVSVLEEVPIQTVEDILHGAARKLKPGGYLIGTHDLLLPSASQRIPQYVAAHRLAGLDLGEEPPIQVDLQVDLTKLLLENPLAVMIWYQMNEPKDTRRYWGHYATIYTVAKNI